MLDLDWPDLGRERPRRWIPANDPLRANRAVHRVMFTNEHGYVPGKKQIDHKCRNRLCVNPDPDHLEMVTHKRNQMRRASARRLVAAK